MGRVCGFVTRQVIRLKSAAAAAAFEVGRCSQPFALVMCGGLHTNLDDDLKAVVREEGNKWRVVKAQDAPSHSVSMNITTGYRPALTIGACLRSLLRIHNETVNIW